MALLFLKKFNLTFSFNFTWRGDIAVLFAFVFFGHFSNLVNLLNYRLDRWLVEAWRGAAELGFYTVAVGLSENFLFGSKTFSTVLFPFFSSQASHDKFEQLSFFSRINFTVVLTALVAMFLVADFIVPFIYGSAFVLSITPLKILIPGVLISALSSPFSAYIAANNLVKYNLFAVLAGLVVTVSLDILLIPELGIIGASIASISAYFIKDVVVFSVFFFRLKAPFKNYFFMNRQDVKLVVQKLRSIFKS